MSEWKKSGCALCNQNCGLELLIENNRIVKVRETSNLVARDISVAKVGTSPTSSIMSRG